MLRHAIASCNGRKPGIRIAGLALAIGCSTSAELAPRLSPIPQPDFYVSYQDFDSIPLSWTPAGGTVTGYVLEGRVVPGQFQSFQQVPSFTTSAVVRLGMEVPELTDLEFRV